MPTATAEHCRPTGEVVNTMSRLLGGTAFGGTMRTRTSRRLGLVAVVAVTTLAATACPPDPGPGIPVVPSVYMSPQFNQGYFSLPWPNDTRRTDAGMKDWTGLPGINTDILTEPLPPIPILPNI